MSTATTGRPLSDILDGLGACEEARQWAAPYATLTEAWAVCERADWMLWLIARTVVRDRESAERKRLVLCACACARTALRYVKEGETRPLAAIETAEKWARGEDGVTLAQVRAAYADAAAAAYAAADAADAAYAAAYAAADAAYAADAAAAAYAAADAAYAYAAAADVAARRRTRATRLKELAELVRQHYPTPPEIA